MRTLASVWMAALVLGGCAMQTETPGGSSAGLTIVQKADFESQLFYIDREVSSAPLTAEQAAGLESAVPVRIVFYDEWAVAWSAPQGEAMTGAIENMINAWRLYDHAEATDGTLSEGSTSTTESPSIITSIDTSPVQYDTTTTTGVDVINSPFARLDWFRDNFEEFLALPPGYHPGCI